LIKHFPQAKETETLIDKKCILFKIEDEISVRPDSNTFPQKLLLDLWDIPNNKKFTTSTQVDVLGSSDVCLLVYSPYDLQSFHAIEDFYRKMIDQKAHPSYILVALSSII
jgi:hypothetical protein